MERGGGRVRPSRERYDCAQHPVSGQPFGSPTAQSLRPRPSPGVGAAVWFAHRAVITTARIAGCRGSRLVRPPRSHYDRAHRRVSGRPSGSPIAQSLRPRASPGVGAAIGFAHRAVMTTARIAGCRGRHWVRPPRDRYDHVRRIAADLPCRGNPWSQSQKSRFGGMPGPRPDRRRPGDGAILGLLRQAPCGCPLLVRRWPAGLTLYGGRVLRIGWPARGVVEDVGADAFERSVVADDVFVIVALP